MTNKERYNKRKTEGICAFCSDRAMDNKTLCIDCNEKQKEKSKKRHHETKELRDEKTKELIHSKLCLDCHKNTDGYKRCVRCRKRRNARDKYRRTVLGKCIDCGKNNNGLSRCDDCRARIRRLKDEAAVNGLCHYCKKPALAGSPNLNYKKKTDSRCQECYLKFISRDHFGTGSRWEDLLNLFVKQNGICPYTGKKLSLGVDTELDHIFPRCRGGSKTDFSNLQWVDSCVNRIKWKFTNEEFLEFIKQVYEYRIERK